MSEKQFRSNVIWLAKWLIVVALVVWAIISVFVLDPNAYRHAIYWFKHTRHVENIEVAVLPPNHSESTNRCKEFSGSRLLVRVSNSSSRTIMSLKISFSGSLPGRSTNVLEPHTANLDHITAPNELLSFCQKLTVSPKYSKEVESANDLFYSATVHSVKFE